jgi:integrase
MAHDRAVAGRNPTMVRIEEWNKVVLGGDAGLRLGELLALEWGDIDFTRSLLHVQRSDWRGRVGPPEERQAARHPDDHAAGSRWRERPRGRFRS